MTARHDRHGRLGLALLVGVGTAGCGDEAAQGFADAQVPGQPPATQVCRDADDRADAFADCVDAFAPAPDVSFGHDAMPDIVLGPPMPAAAGSGGMDVASLGCGGSITLWFGGEGIVDGDGPDLRVFENAFATGQSTFTEPARVLVSDDGLDWYGFGCEPSGDGTWPPAGCAGVTPTGADGDALDPRTAGGDAFDLADVGLPSARWVRLLDMTAEHYGDAMWCAGAAGGFDLDAVVATESWRSAPDPSRGGRR